jgi:hypothetical protein
LPRSGLFLCAALFSAFPAGCGWTSADVAQQSDIVTYRVRSGDTLTTIASKRSCTVAQLREWNHLEGDLITTGQVLVIHRGEAPTPVASGTRRPTARQGSHHVRQGELVDPGDAPLKIRVDAAIEDGSGLGLLDAFDESNQALSGKIDGGAAANRPSSTIGTSSGLGARGTSLDEAGTAEKLAADPAVSAPEVAGSDSPPIVGSAPVSAPKLAKALPKKCLPPPSADDLGDDDAVASEGLTVDDIRGGMRAPVQAAAQCLPAGTHGNFQVVLEVTAGCNGLVSQASIDDAGGLPRAVTDCISATVAQAGFPAHALPDGATFYYPIRFAAD